MKPKEVHRNGQLAQKLKQTLDQISCEYEKFDQTLVQLDSSVDKHCEEIRNQIDLISEQKIIEINEIRFKYLKHVDDYRQLCQNNIQQKKPTLERDLNECKKFIDEGYTFLKGVNFEDKLVEMKSQEAVKALENFKAANERLLVAPYNGQKVKFEPNQRELNDEFIGTFDPNIARKKLNSDLRLVSGSVDRTLKVWNLKTNQCEDNLNGHESSVTCVAVLDNTIIVTGSADRTIKLWDLETGRCIKTYREHTDNVYCLLTIGPKIIVSGSWDKTIKIWYLNQDKSEKTLVGHTHNIDCLCLINEKQLVSGSHDQTLKVWNSIGWCEKTLIGHTNVVHAVAKIDANRVVSGSYDRTLKIWDIQKAICLITLSDAHLKCINCVISIDPTTFASGSDDKTIKIWKLNPNESVTCEKILKGHSESVRCFSRAWHENTFASASDDKTIKIWNLNSNTPIQTLQAHDKKICCLSIV